MANTFADMMGSGAPEGATDMSDRDAFIAYQQTCIEEYGVRPVGMTEWVQAGKPPKPPPPKLPPGQQ